MKKLVLTISLLAISSICFAEGLIHPLDFKGTEAEKKQVIALIEQNVKETYTALGMGDPSTLRMMEKTELDSFKQLTQVTNRNLLDSVIDQYCSIGMCDYNTILMMYKEQERESNKKLQW